MSKRVRLAVWFALFLFIPFIAMPFMEHKFGMIGLTPCLAIGLLLGISFFPHVLREGEDDT